MLCRSPSGYRGTEIPCARSLFGLQFFGEILRLADGYLSFGFFGYPLVTGPRPRPAAPRACPERIGASVTKPRHASVVVRELASTSIALEFGERLSGHTDCDVVAEGAF